MSFHRSQQQSKQSSILDWFQSKNCVPNPTLQASLTSELEKKRSLLKDISKLTEDVFMTVFSNLQHNNQSLTDQQWSNFIKYLKGQSVTELCRQLNSLLHDFFTFMEQNNEKTIANNISKISTLYLGKILHYFNKDIIPRFKQKEPGDGHNHIRVATANSGDFASMENFLKELLKIKKELKKIGTKSTKF